MKNVACSRLGNMLYLDIQKGEGGYEDRNISTADWEGCIVNEETNDG